MTTANPEIPSRRIAPTSHLTRAAQAPIDSNAEHYHLAAAQAEALARVEHQLAKIEQHLGLLTEIASSVAEVWLERHR